MSEKSDFSLDDTSCKLNATKTVSVVDSKIVSPNSSRIVVMGQNGRSENDVTKLIFDTNNGDNIIFAERTYKNPKNNELTIETGSISDSKLGKVKHFLGKDVGVVGQAMKELGIACIDGHGEEQTPVITPDQVRTMNQNKGSSIKVGK